MNNWGSSVVPGSTEAEGLDQGPNRDITQPATGCEPLTYTLEFSQASNPKWRKSLNVHTQSNSPHAVIFRALSSEQVYTLYVGPKKDQVIAVASKEERIIFSPQRI